MLVLMEFVSAVHAAIIMLDNKAPFRGFYNPSDRHDASSDRDKGDYHRQHVIASISFGKTCLCVFNFEF